MMKIFTIVSILTIVALCLGCAPDDNQTGDIDPGLETPLPTNPPEPTAETQETPDETQVVGGDKDEHGCIGSAGYVWCEAKQKCLREWEEACEEDSMEIECIAAGGNWNECSNRCMLENVGQENVPCPTICEQLCECGGIAGFSCPEGYICKVAEGVADAMGYCDEEEVEPLEYESLEEYYASLDYECNVDEDCEVKDKHNCCGYYPDCMNVDAVVAPEFVRQACGDEGLSGVCGFPSIDECKCIDNQCKSMQAGEIVN